ncbi:MAG: M24 family metallopeptidase C-terminal domain-containing protein, partial [Alphaproteobacteria bacterium]|nr:M24 family metallopeptidase C-terminal domain-containing protein [Alphaproteobacteria bacterium]
GAYGIRIENLITVRESAPLSGGKKPFLEFEALTLAPIDLGLVDAKMLSGPERAWLNDYHRRVLETLSPLLDADTVAWLKSATRAI